MNYHFVLKTPHFVSQMPLMSVKGVNLDNQSDNAL
jgi:hypothetical protein